MVKTKNAGAKMILEDKDRCPLVFKNQGRWVDSGGPLGFGEKKKERRHLIEKQRRVGGGFGFSTIRE